MKLLGNYIADAGSILLTPVIDGYSPSTGVLVANAVGDGDFDAYLLEEKDDRSARDGSRLRFEAMLYGDWDVRSYDCDLSSDIIGTIESDRFGVYHDDRGNIYIEIWDEKGKMKGEK